MIQDLTLYYFYKRIKKVKIDHLYWKNKSCLCSKSVNFKDFETVLILIFSLSKSSLNKPNWRIKRGTENRSKENENLSRMEKYLSTWRNVSIHYEHVASNVQLLTDMIGLYYLKNITWSANLGLSWTQTRLMRKIHAHWLYQLMLNHYKSLVGSSRCYH